MPTGPHPGPLASAVAVVASLAASAAALAALLLLVPMSARGTVARQMDGEIAAHGAGVLVLGNSVAGAGVDDVQLSTALGRGVTKLTIPNSPATAWYAVLQRVAQRGLEPDLVMIAATRHDMLSLRRGPGDEELLQDLGAAADPVLLERLHPGGERLARWRALDVRRKHLRQQLVMLGPAAAAAPIVPGGLWSARDQLERSFGLVFDVRNVDFGRMDVERISPVAVESAPPVEQGMVVPLADLAAELGASLVFVRMPVAPGSLQADPVSTAEERALVALLNDIGVGYLDLSDTPLRPGNFQDPYHLDTTGRAHLTTALGEALEPWMDGAGGVLLPPAPLPVEQQAAYRYGDAPWSRTLELLPTPGEDPGCPFESQELPVLQPFHDTAMEALGLAHHAPFAVLENGVPLEPRPSSSEPCGRGEFALEGRRVRVRPLGPRGRRTHLELVRIEADATEQPGQRPVHWVYPGSTLAIEFASGWKKSRGPFAVTVVAQPFGDSDPPGLVVLDGQVRAPLHAEGGQARATLQATPPPGPWSLAVSSPPQGPHLAVLGVALGTGAQKVLFSTARSRPLETGVALLGTHSDRTSAEWVGSPATVPPGPVERRIQPKGPVGVLRVPDLAELSDPATGRCSPVSVLEDGVRLPRRHTACRLVPWQQGAMCHTRDVIHFTSSDGSPPRHNGRTYTLGLHRGSGKFCRTDWWLLPGDSIRVRLTRADFRNLYRFADRIELSGVVSSRTAVTHDIEASLIVDGDRVFHRMIPAARLADGGTVFELRTPVRADATAGVFELHNPHNGAFVLVRSAVLLEQSGWQQAPDTDVPQELARTPLDL